MRALTLLKRVIDKSPATIAFRGSQEARLKVMQITRGWQSLEWQLSHWASLARADAWNTDGELAALASDAAMALREAVDQGHLDGESLIDAGNAVMQKDISVFGAPLPCSGPWPWHQDWRFEQKWPPAYFRDYAIDAPRSQPYDVKFPWELSRLTFLQRLVQADLVTGEKHRTAALFDILRDWKAHNPLAYSVNWNPMEAAMRGVGLCLISDMSRLAGIGGKDAKLLMELLGQHGEFVMRTIEVTDNAANHYIAELVALLLIGRTLQGRYRPARRWYKFAKHRLSHEATSQFLSDGVNFEKSTAYHRLVQDLFVLGSIALQRDGNDLESEQKARLHSAARYNGAFLRPDNKCPLIGDSDDAIVFASDDAPVRDHRPSLGVAALAFRDGELKAAAEELPVAGVWLFGKQALEDWHQMPVTEKPFSGHHYFSQGGMVVSRSDKHYLIMDVGEVGQNGLGGHGHNDLLSFEFFFNGRPLIIDPGSYLYSGDFTAHAHFRSTRSHNGMMLDDQEIAPLTGKFRIANQARPTNVRVEERDERISVIEAGHTGYQALADPVMHERTLLFERHMGALHCKDQLQAKTNHHAVRRLHFAPGVTPVIGEHGLHIDVGGEVILIRWDHHSEGTLRDTEVSRCYGQLKQSSVLEITTQTSQEPTLTLDIYPESHGPLHAGGIE